MSSAMIRGKSTGYVLLISGYNTRGYSVKGRDRHNYDREGQLNAQFNYCYYYVL